MEKALEIVMIIVLLSPFAASVIAAVVYIRRAVKSEIHRKRNTILGVVFAIIPVLLYVALYIFGRVLTG